MGPCRKPCFIQKRVGIRASLPHRLRFSQLHSVTHCFAARTYTEVVTPKPKDSNASATGRRSSCRPTSARRTSGDAPDVGQIALHALAHLREPASSSHSRLA